MSVHSSPKRAAMVAGFGLSALMLGYAFRRVDAESFGRAFSSINPLMIFFSAVLLSASILLRSLRWRLIAGFSKEAQLNFTRATNLGVLGNLIFPGRAGEFVRVITLARLSRSTMTIPLASAFIDRLVDVGVLVVCAAVVYCFLPISEIIRNHLLIVLITGVIVLIALLLARKFNFGGAWETMLAKRWIRRFPLKLDIFLAELRIAFLRILRGRLTIELACLVSLILFVDYAAIATLLRAFDLSLPVEAALLLWVFLAIGSALPSAPSYVGVYQLAAVWALSVYDVPASTAVATATMLQITTLTVAIVLVGPSAFGILKTILFPKDAAVELGSK